MAKKDINIKLNLRGGKETAEGLKKTGVAGKQAGEQIAHGQKKATDSVEHASKKVSKFSDIVGGLRTAVVGWVAGFAGLAGATKLLDMVAERLTKISNLLKEIHQNNLSLQEIGQQLELQTGTVGKQKFWSKKAGQVQQKGSLSNPNQASQILTALDINYGLDSGKNKQTMQLAEDIAPLFGASNMGPAEIQQFFSLAKTAGVKPNIQEFQKFYAQTRSAFTKGDANDFGKYLEGLNTGTQGYIQAGAGLEEAAAMYNQALSVYPGNTAAAATLAQNITKLSAGAYEKPRKAIEKNLGVKWDQLSPSEQVDALVEFTNSVPENKRVQYLVEAGFEPGYAKDLVNFSSPNAQAKSKDTAKSVESAKVDDTVEFVEAYKKTPLAASRSIEAEKNIRDVEIGNEYADWNNEVERKKQELEKQIIEGKDKFWVDPLPQLKMLL